MTQVYLLFGANCSNSLTRSAIEGFAGDCAIDDSAIPPQMARMSAKKALPDVRNVSTP
jgi:hypothetical protein